MAKQFKSKHKTVKINGHKVDLIMPIGMDLPSVINTKKSRVSS